MSRLRSLNVNPVTSKLVTGVLFHQRESSVPYRSNFKRKFWMAAAMMASLVVGCDALSTGTAQNIDKTKGKDAMELAIAKETTAVAIPPMDESVPQQVSTATFALG